MSVVVFLECSVGYYGNKCDKKCNCNRNASCDIITGSCDCPAGFMLPNCYKGMIITSCSWEQLLRSCITWLLKTELNLTLFWLEISGFLISLFVSSRWIMSPVSFKQFHIAALLKYRKLNILFEVGSGKQDPPQLGKHRCANTFPSLNLLLVSYSSVTEHPKYFYSKDHRFDSCRHC